MERNIVLHVGFPSRSNGNKRRARSPRRQDKSRKITAQILLYLSFMVQIEKQKMNPPDFHCGRYVTCALRIRNAHVTAVDGDRTCANVGDGLKSL